MSSLLNHQSPKTQKDLRILVVKNRAMGDSLIGLACLSYIKSIFTNSQITYGLPAWIIPLYSQVETAADSYLNIDLKKISDYFRLFRELRRHSFDVMIELHQSGRTGRFFKFYSLLTGISYYFHNHHQKEGTFILRQGERRSAIQKDLDACWSIAQHLHLDPTREIPQTLDYTPQMKIKNRDDHLSLQNHAAKKIIILGVVATRATKMWPLEFYRELVQLMLKKDPDLQFFIPLSPSADDQKIAETIQLLAFPSQAQIVQKPLSELPELIQKSLFYVGNDTGLKHLSVSLGIPTYTFFGPEEPLEWHPYDHHQHPYFFIEGLPCRTQTAHFCGLQTCEMMICLNQITPDQVWQKIQQKQWFRS